MTRPHDAALAADLARDRRAILRREALRQSAVDEAGLAMVREAIDRARLMEWRASAEAIEHEARTRLEAARTARAVGRRSPEGLDLAYRDALAREARPAMIPRPARRRGRGLLAAFFTGLVVGLFGG
ncbi:MAG: hypothetical protein OEL76_10690 [Siculibacillus sp.]|nr:hypothetical protein [Siculibacillus sp.]